MIKMGRVDGRLHKIGGFGVDEPLVKAVQRVVQMLPQRRTAVQPLPQLVSEKDDTIVLETGSDRTKIRFRRTAIASVEKLDMGGKDTTPAKK